MKHTNKKHQKKPFYLSGLFFCLISKYKKWELKKNLFYIFLPKSMNNSAASTISLSNSMETTQLMNSISDCCDNIFDALNISFDKVSAFASQVWSGVVQWDLFVDKIVFNLMKLKQHLNDFVNAIQKETTDFIADQVIPFLYDIEWKLISTMQANTFLYNTFGWLITWILSLIKFVRRNLQLS